MNNCTVELGCIYLPVGYSERDLEASRERRAEWNRGRAACDALGVRCSFEVNRDHGEIVGDAYACPAVESLEALLRALDEADVDYDDIDLPADAPPDFVSRLRSAYPQGQGVWVNVQGG